MSPNHEGTHWVRIEQPREEKIIFKQVNYMIFKIKLNVIVYFTNILHIIFSRLNVQKTLFGVLIKIIQFGLKT